MPLPAALPVTLIATERKTLKMRVRGAKTCWRDRLRPTASDRGRGQYAPWRLAWRALCLGHELISGLAH